MIVSASGSGQDKTFEIDGNHREAVVAFEVDHLPEGTGSGMGREDAADVGRADAVMADKKSAPDHRGRTVDGMR
jgi:hypothetical protein